MNEFIANNYQAISVLFGSLAAIFVLLRVSLMGLKSLVSYIESNQRMRYQAEFFDRNDLIIKQMNEDISLLKQTYAANNGRVIKSD